MKNYVLFIISLFVFTCASAQNIEVFKKTENKPITKQSFIYALPQTSINITLEVSKTTIIKGPYAEYAQKYLKITNVPLKDSSSWSISNIKVNPQKEADPLQLFVITFKKFPEHLRQLFSLTSNGIVLDFEKASLRTKILSQDPEHLFDPFLTEELNKEKIDTFYKTVMTDSSFVRIPVFKKEIQAKTTEDIVKETALEITKTRKRKLKILRGEYDFHPDGDALKVMITELDKYEEQLMQMFTGKKIIEKQYYTFTIVPQQDNLNTELCRFDKEKGIQTAKTSGGSAVTLQLTREQEPAKGINPDKAKNMLYLRAPIMSNVMVKLDNKNLSTVRIPIYQFGPVVSMPL